MKKLLYLAALSVVVCLTGCTSASLKMEPDSTTLAQRQMPVKFKFSRISWNEKSKLQRWFFKPQIINFINLIKNRAPDLFSEDPKAIPLTFYFELDTKDTTNNGLLLLSFLNAFTIFPGIICKEVRFDVQVIVGEKGEYVENNSFKIHDRLFLSTIPFYAFLMPSQSDSFCHGLVDVIDKAVYSAGLQNAFLNMIYRLNDDKLRRLHDDKHGEKVTLLEIEQ